MIRPANATQVAQTPPWWSLHNGRILSGDSAFTWMHGPDFLTTACLDRLEA